jgi:large subunit ribosomal protein L4
MAMYKARYYKADGKKGRARELPESLFDGVVHKGAMYQAVRAYQLNQRQGTAQKKNRAAVRGGSRKPWRQKGTGRARQGTIRAPQWNGGGLAFPPQAHSWRQDLPRKVRALARRSALNARAGEDRVVLVDALELENPKTKQLLEYLQGIEVEGKVLLLTEGVNENAVLSARNVKEIRVMPFGQEAPYDILWAGTVVIERPALEAWEAARQAREEAGPVEVIEAPPASESEAPEAKESEAPEAKKRKAPATKKSKAPEAKESEAPTASDDEAPAAGDTPDDAEAAEEKDDA